MDDLFSVENLSKLAGKPNFGIAKLPQSNGESSSSAKIVVPIEVTDGDSTITLNAEAEFNLKFNIDLRALMETRDIVDTEQKLNKMRRCIQVDTRGCKVNIKH